MKIAEILRTLADAIDAQEQQQTVTVVKKVEPVQTDITDATKYSTKPRTFNLSAAFPEGNDVHHTKNPADIRSDSLSMYPDWQARKGN